MKTFDKKDLITWVNCNTAVPGKVYYFSNTIYGMECRIKNNSVHTLIRVDESLIDNPFVFENDIGECHAACALPIESVKEENTYRPCKTNIIFIFYFFKFIIIFIIFIFFYITIFITN